MSTPAPPEPPAPDGPTIRPRRPSPPPRPTVRRTPAPPPPTLRAALVHGDLPWIVLFGALLFWTATEAGGGLTLGSLTWVLVALTVLGGVAGIAALLFGRRPERPWGAVTIGAFVLLVVLTGLSITWSITPSTSWIETNRTLGYLAVLGGAAACAHLAPSRWQAMLGGLLLGATAICGWALMSKVLPAQLAADETLARLRAVYGYWNALGVVAGMGLLSAVWLATRRHGYRPLNALAFPAGGVLMVALLLSLSRGSIAAALVGLAVWVLLAPRRLHSLLTVAVIAVVAVPVALWAFQQTGISMDRAGIELRVPVGRNFGLLLLAMLGVLSLAGLGVGFASMWAAPNRDTRRRLGYAVALGLALIPVGLAIGAATSEQGFGGSVDSALSSFTDASAVDTVGGASRLTTAGSIRGRYWADGLRIHDDRPWVGVGAGGYGQARQAVREDDLEVLHAHSYVVQTLSDLGWLGFAASLAATLAWLAAAGRAIGLYGPGRGPSAEAVARRRDLAGRPRRWDPERLGLLMMICLVLTFGVSSAIDWTWIVPGVALAALAPAGWVAARSGRTLTEDARLAGEAALARHPELDPNLTGGFGARGPRRPLRLDDAAALRRVLPALGVAVVLVATVWTITQPRRAETASREALVALGGDSPRDVARAQSLADEARRLNPLSPEPWYTQAAIDVARDDLPAAKRAYDRAIEQEPLSGDTWARLARFELVQRDDARASLRASARALRLDPRSRSARLVALRAQQQIATSRAAAQQQGERGGSGDG